MWKIIEQDCQLYLCTQKQNQSDIEYMKAFQNAVDAINEAGGRAGATYTTFHVPSSSFVKNKISFHRSRLSRIRHLLHYFTSGNRVGWEDHP